MYYIVWFHVVSHHGIWSAPPEYWQQLQTIWKLIYIYVYIQLKQGM